MHVNHSTPLHSLKSTASTFMCGLHMQQHIFLQTIRASVASAVCSPTADAVCASLTAAASVYPVGVHTADAADAARQLHAWQQIVCLLADVLLNTQHFMRMCHHRSLQHSWSPMTRPAVMHTPMKCYMFGGTSASMHATVREEEEAELCMVKQTAA